MANVSAILMAWKCSELLEKCYCIEQCQMSVDKWLTWAMWVSSLIKRKNICKTFSKPFSWYFFKFTQLWFAKWFTKPCIFVLNKCSLKWADQKRLIYSNSKQEITNNDVIMCQYISTLKKQNIHDGDVTPLAEKEVQLRYATWTNLYKSSLATATIQVSVFLLLFRILLYTIFQYRLPPYYFVVEPSGYLNKGSINLDFSLTTNNLGKQREVGSKSFFWDNAKSFPIYHRCVRTYRSIAFAISGSIRIPTSEKLHFITIVGCHKRDLL